MGRALVYTQYGIGGFIWSGLSAAYLAVYALYGHEPCSAPLGLYVLVAGIALIASMLLSFGMLPEALENADKDFSKRVAALPDSPLAKFFYYTSQILNLFSFGWFIAGNVWTFGTNADNCNATLFHFCFGMIISQWVLVGLLCCACCTILCCACYGTIFTTVPVEEKKPLVV